MSRTIEQVKKEIEDLKNEMRWQEMGNDFYYTKGSYYDDKTELNKLERELKELEETNE